MEVSDQLHAPDALAPAEQTDPHGYETRWNTEPVRALLRRAKSLTYDGNRKTFTPLSVRSLVTTDVHNALSRFLYLTLG
jgi:hypothetical protein